MGYHERPKRLFLPDGERGKPKEPPVPENDNPF
jgi:hypothetical protein